jgi:hypothetical protein
MKNKQDGCAILIATVNGKPFEGMHANASTLGAPNLVPGSYKQTVADEGFVSSLVIKDLSSKGGSGSATLMTSGDKPYTTGSITLTKRIKEKVPDN